MPCHAGALGAGTSRAWNLQLCVQSTCRTFLLSSKGAAQLAEKGYSRIMAESRQVIEARPKLEGVHRYILAQDDTGARYWSYTGFEAY